jgi:hypothetical protein
MTTRAAAFFAALFLSACATTSVFNQAAYEQATSLKVDALALVAESSEPYQEHAAEARDLMRRVDKAYEYAAGLPNNARSTEQWQILRDPAGHLLGGYLAKWAADGTETPAEAADVKTQIGTAFDEIIGLESGKVKAGGS